MFKKFHTATAAAYKSVLSPEQGRKEKQLKNK
jgi:hypothetical protein